MIEQNPMEKMVYDGNGALTEDTTGNDTTVSIWNGVNTVFQKNLGTGVATKYIMADGMQIAYIARNKVYYSHEDILGSVRLVSTGTDATKFSSNYAPYGSNYGVSGADAFQYAGKPVDPVTGYYDFGGRWYDPSTGRFITQDSSSGVQEDGQSLNRYIYADNNPEKNVDPNGHGWLSALTSAVSEAAGSLASAASNAWNSLPPPVQTVIAVAAVTGAIVATGGAAAPAILAGAAAMGGLNAALSVGQEAASGRSFNPRAALDGFTAGFALGPVALLAGGDDDLTNDESTWTNPTPATQEDELFLARDYVPSLCNSYIYEKEGGWTEITSIAGGRVLRIDNITPDGTIAENKATYLTGAMAQSQLSTYLSYLDEYGGKLEYNFFRSPSGSPVGPSEEFSSLLAAASTKYAVGVNYYDYDWWDEIQ